MAASGFTPIQLYYSVTATNIPLVANLTYGELAINAADGKMYYKSTAGGGTVVKIADAATATGSVSGGTAGALVYQSAPSTSAFVNIGTSTYILTSNGTVPVYTNPASITVGLATLATSATTAGSATTATTATNLAGGTANQLAYQSGAGATTFAPAPSIAGYVLGWSGSAFSWVVAPAAVSAINLTGGGANTVVYQSSAGTTAYLTNGTTGQVLGANTGGAPSWVTGGSNAYTRTTYTATASQTTFAVTYTVGYVQVYLNGVLLTAVDYTATNGTSVVLTIGAALNDIVEFLAFNTTPISNTSTTNLLAGTAGQVPYQSAPGATAFTGPGSAGGVFYSAGASTPSFTTAGTTGQALVSAGASAPAFGTLPIAGGGTNTTATPTAGTVPYGTGTALAYSAVGTTGQALVSAGASAPAFGTLGVAGGGTNSTATPTAGGVGYGTGTAHAYSAVGTNGQVLTSAGASAPTWTTPSVGALTLLATVTPTAAANVDFLNTFSATYDCYLITCTGVTPSSYTSSPGPLIRVAVGGTVDTASSYNGFFNINSSAVSSTQLNTTSTNYGPYSFQLFIQNANETTNFKYMTLQLQYSPNGSANDPTGNLYVGAYRGTSAISGLRIYWSNGTNFTATGKIRIYGYSNS